MKRIPFPKSCVNTANLPLTPEQLRQLPVLAKDQKIDDDSRWSVETTDSDHYGYGRVLVLFEVNKKQSWLDTRAAWLMSKQEAEDVLVYTHNRHFWHLTLERLAKLKDETSTHQ